MPPDESRISFSCATIRGERLIREGVQKIFVSVEQGACRNNILYIVKRVYHVIIHNVH
jgi:hypothetical protein